tara:strand:+ start:852 stop:1136 length:285 start_codon:yes stop_codon:yes gene_type:complete
VNPFGRIFNMKEKSDSGTEHALKQRKPCTRTRLGNINPKKGLSQYFIHFFSTEKLYPSFKKLNVSNKEPRAKESIAIPKLAKYPLTSCQLKRML